MIRSNCEFETSKTKCSKITRSRIRHQYCREHFKLVNNTSRPIARTKKVKQQKYKSEVPSTPKKKR